MTNSTSGVLILMSATSNKTFTDMGKLYDSFNFTELITYLYALLFFPMAIIGFILNVLILLVMAVNSSQFSIPLYHYTRVTVWTGVLGNLDEIFLGLYYSRRVIPPTNNYPWVWFVTYINPYVHNTLLFYRSALDILIVLDRLAVFEPKLKFITKVPPWALSLATFIFTWGISLPQIFFYRIVEYRILNTATGEVVPFGVSGSTPFVSSLLGRVLLYILYFIRNVLTLAIEIILNFVSVYYFQKFVKKKARLVKPATDQSMLAITNTNQSTTTGNTQKQAAKQNASHESSMFIMVMILVLIAVIQQCVSLAFYVYTTLLGLVSIQFTFFLNFFGAVRFTIFFFVYYGFNSVFSKATRRFFKL